MAKKKMNVEAIKNKAKKNIRAAIKKGHVLIDKQMKLAKKKLAQTEKKMTDAVHRNPKKALGIAAGVGVALGAILGATAVALAKRKKK